MTRTLLSTALASAVMLSAAQAQTIGTATTDLNLRSGPDPQFPVIGMIRENRRATVLGCIEGSRWCQVDLNGRTGWAYAQYLRLTGDIAVTLPVPELEVNVAAGPIVTAPPPVAVYPAPAPVATYQAPVYQAPPPVYQPPVATYRPPVVTYQAPPPVVAYQTAPMYQTAPVYRPPAVAYRAPAARTVEVAETTGVAPREYSGSLITPRELVYAATTPPPAYVPPTSIRTYVTTNPMDSVYLEGNLTVGAGLPRDVELMPVPRTRYHYAYVNDYPVLVDPATRRIVYISR